MNNNDPVTGDRLRDLLLELQTKVSQDALLSTKYLDEDFLLKFLRIREYDVDATVILMKGYFVMRVDHPELFQLPSQVADVFKDKVFTITPKRNSTGELVVLFRPGFWDVKKYDAYHICAAPVPFFELHNLDPVVQEKGMLEILDFSNITWRQFTSMPASLHKLSADLSERALPLKYKKIHIVNQGKLVDILWAIMKPFVSEEMKQRLAFHGANYTELHKDIDRELLPPDLGGTDSEEDIYTPEYLSLLDRQIKELWTKYA